MISVSGGAEARLVAAKLRKAAAVDLTRELRKGQRQAVAPLQKEIKASAAVMLPKRGGYAPLMAKDVKVSTRVGVREGTLVVRIYARGQTELRDVRTINAGILRHPIYGRFRMTKDGPMANPWKAQRVPRGFVDKPVDRLIDRIARESADAAGRVLQKIARL